MLRSTICSLVAVIVLAGSVGRICGADDLSGARAKLYADYAGQLDELAAWCEDEQLSEATAALKDWLPERAPERFTLFVLPRAGSGEPVSKTTLPEWRKRWQVLRDEQAAALFELARRAVDGDQPSLAYELAVEAVRENPNHKAARRAAGYVKFRDGWYTPFEVRQLGRGKVWHETFGWMPADHVERYERGERYYQGRWMPAAEEAQLRADLERGWRVESTHYVVTTNHSLEEGVRLSRQLERLHDIWRQVFISFTDDAARLRRRFAGRAPRGKQHNVVYFRDRDQYNLALRPAQPKIDITLGIYLDRTRTAYFFAGEDQDPGTIYHEATHQLFQESRPVVHDVGARDNFWVVEGVACYMESLEDRGGYVTLGGPNAGRVPAARHRLVVDGFYVPLSELVQLGMTTLQADERLPRIYSQSAGLADFLMHDQRGRYRRALVEYLVGVYSGRAGAGTLAQRTGTDYDTLDRQYEAFIRGDGPAEASDQATRSVTTGR